MSDEQQKNQKPQLKEAETGSFGRRKQSPSEKRAEQIVASKVRVVPGVMAGRRFRTTLSGKTPSDPDNTDPIVIDCTHEKPVTVPAEHAFKVVRYIEQGYLAEAGSDGDKEAKKKLKEEAQN